MTTSVHVISNTIWLTKQSCVINYTYIDNIALISNRLKWRGSGYETYKLCWDIILVGVRKRKTTPLSRQFQNPIETTVTTEATPIPVAYI